MRIIFKDKVFWIFFLLISVMVFFFSLERKESYLSEARVIFLIRSEVLSRNAEQVIENARQIPRSLSFYDKMLELNSDIDDPVEEWSASKRKDYWNDQISINRPDKSGVLEISIAGENPMQSEIVLKQVVASLGTVMNNYYGDKSNLEMRLIDGPISRVSEEGDYKRSLILGGVAGFSGALIISLLINFLVILFSKSSQKSKIEEPLDLSQETKNETRDLEKIAPSVEKRRELFDFSAEQEAALVWPPKKKFSFFGKKEEKKASAPSNLPIAENFDMSVFRNLPMDDRKNDLAVEETSAIISEEGDEMVLDLGEEKKTEQVAPVLTVAPDNSHREATPEEVKKRLNQLLGGK